MYFDYRTHFYGYFIAIMTILSLSISAYSTTSLNTSSTVQLPLRQYNRRFKVDGRNRNAVTSTPKSLRSREDDQMFVQNKSTSVRWNHLRHHQHHAKHNTRDREALLYNLRLGSNDQDHRNQNSANNSVLESSKSLLPTLVDLPKFNKAAKKEKVLNNTISKNRKFNKRRKHQDTARRRTAHNVVNGGHNRGHGLKKADNKDTSLKSSNYFHTQPSSSPSPPLPPPTSSSILHPKTYLNSTNSGSLEASTNFRDRRSWLHKTTKSTKNGQAIVWPQKKIVEIPGDVMLGGLMMVHERQDDMVCGPVMPQGGVQAVEAMLYTLDWINTHKNMFIPGMNIGALILDDCDKDTYGLEQAVDFIKGSISNIDDGEYTCKDGSSPEVRNKVIDGVVGAASSVTSIQVANLLRLFKIPQVSFFSTSPELSNKQRFEYFSRTIPSDHHQVQVMVDIVLELKWSYISIIYEESNYGIKAFEHLQDLLPTHGVCIAVKEKLVKDSGVADDEAYDHIVTKLLSKSRARGVIVFASDQEVAEVMKAVKRKNAQHTFSWIGSDGWSERALVSRDNEDVVEGTISVQPQANTVQGFKEYFTKLTVENNERNPWFFEYWEDHFECKYPNRSFTPYNNYSRECTGRERLSPDTTTIEAQLQFVSDAVMAFAHAFRDLHAEKCNGEPGRCKAMDKINGVELLTKLRKVKFRGLSGDDFQFDELGDGPARYRIIHFKKVNDQEYEWVEVGKYTDGHLYLNKSQVQFRQNESIPVSVCTEDCILGQAKKMMEGETCCWHCINCSDSQIVVNETSCVECAAFKLPAADKVSCIDIPEVYIELHTWNAIIPMVISSLGLVLTTLTLLVFQRHNDTPVVKASGRELSYVLLGGIVSSYALTFLFVLKPTDSVCGIQRFGLGFCFSVIYSALLTKTNRISRIFNSGKKTRKRPSFISPTSQLLICSALVTFQILVIIVWSLVHPPKAIHFAIDRTDNFLVCEGSIDASYITAFTYPFCLVIVCTLYAWRTRKIPEAFNESKYIGFTMYTTCVIWLAFVPIYFITASDNRMRITTIAVTTSLSGSVALACLFFPKVYIIICHPERNQRSSKLTGQKMHSMRSHHQNTIVSHHTTTAAVAAPATIRVDSSTQSEVVFPSTLELQERMKAAHGGVYIGDTSLSCAAVSTQTCSTCYIGGTAGVGGTRASSTDEDEEEVGSSGGTVVGHTCDHSHVLEPSSRCNGSVARLRTSVQSASNGPLQDVPDVML